MCGKLQPNSTLIYRPFFEVIGMHEIESHQVIQLITFSSTFLVYASYQFLEHVMIQLFRFSSNIIF